MMDYRWVPYSEGLKPSWKEALSLIVESFKKGIIVRPGDANGRTRNALIKRNYLDYEIQKCTGLEMVVPTKKALALWRDDE